MTKQEAIKSIFGLLQSEEQSQGLGAWLMQAFPAEAECAAFHLANQVRQLFEMAVFENQIETVHFLLQQGVPADTLGDWNTTPLMWATCLGYDEIATLLVGYGANQHATCFSGKTAEDFRIPVYCPEYSTILERKKQIHALVSAGVFPPLTEDTSAGSRNSNSGSKSRPKSCRQIDNGKGIDELLKKLTKKSS